MPEFDISFATLDFVRRAHPLFAMALQRIRSCLGSKYPKNAGSGTPKPEKNLIRGPTDEVTWTRGNITKGLCP